MGSKKKKKRIILGNSSGLKKKTSIFYFLFAVHWDMWLGTDGENGIIEFINFGEIKDRLHTCAN